MTQDKVKQICDALRVETLEPAKQEAERIIAEASSKAKKIVDEARTQSEKLVSDARVQIEKEKQNADSSMKMAAKQSIESLKEKVEKEFFNRELSGLIDTKMQDSSVVTKLIEAVVGAIEKEGIEADLEALVPKSLSVDEINQALSKAILDRLKSVSVMLGEMDGGAQVKLVDQHMTLDISNEALRELLARYIRDDFRQLIFN